MNFKESRILNKLRNGDKKAFEELFHQYYPGMCSYAESLVNKSEIAEEVVQDVFLNIWKNKTELNILVSWKNYLFRSVYNNSMMYLRKSKREMSLDERWEENQLVGEQLSDEIEAMEMNAVIVYTLQDLPDRTQEIFKLSRFDGLKYKEIAVKLGISIKTVEANMGKALKALRSSIDEYRNTA